MTLPDYDFEFGPPDACATLEPWEDAIRLEAAQATIKCGAPYNESARTELARMFGEELLTIAIAQAHVRSLIDEWHVLVKPPRKFREGLADLRRENLAIVRARVTYQRALTKLKLTHEDKAARAAVLEACIEAFHRGDLHHNSPDLNAAISDWLKLGADEQRRVET